MVVGSQDNDSSTARPPTRGGQNGRHARAQAGRLSNVGGAVFLAVVAVVLLVPSVGMIWAPTESTTENRVLADPPALVCDDGAFNADVLADAGAYFEDHFALRNQMVTANAFIRAAFGSPAGDQVVVGSNGWLYYAATLDDYLGRAPLSDRALRNIAHNLSIMQGYVSYQGASFVFTIAPNKNSLYPANMPYYYVKSAEAGNAARLEPFLEQAGVNYLDLFGVLGSQDDVLYLDRDTHWNNLGALVGTNALLRQLGKPELALEPAQAFARDDFVGDVEGMQYPAALRTEPNWYFEGYNDGEGMSGALWSYVEGSDVTHDWIVTEPTRGSAARSAGATSGEADDADDAMAAGGAEVAEGASVEAAAQSAGAAGAATAPVGGSLLMFRDSFANALIPYWATLFDQATFSKLIPYDVGAVFRTGADTVIVERAERHLPYLAENPPLMPSPGVSIARLPDEDDPRGENTTLTVSRDGSYLVLSGTVDGRAMSDEAAIYVVVDRHDGTPLVFDAFWTSHGVDSSSADSQADVGDGGSDGAREGNQVDAQTDGSGEAAEGSGGNVGGSGGTVGGSGEAVGESGGANAESVEATDDTVESSGESDSADQVYTIASYGTADGASGDYGYRVNLDAAMDGLSGADVEVCVFDSGQMVRCRAFENALL